MAKSNPTVTPIGIKPNLQILPQNNTTFSCFLPDDQSDLRIDSEPAVLIKLKSHVACGKIGWLRLTYNTPSSAAEITSPCLAEESKETHSFHKFCLYITWLQQAACNNSPSYHKNEKVRIQELLIILSLSFELDIPYLLGSEIQPFQLVPNLYLYIHNLYIHTCICIPLDLAYELRLLLWVLTSMRGAPAVSEQPKKFRPPVKDLGIR